MDNNTDLETLMLSNSQKRIRAAANRPEPFGGSEEASAKDSACIDFIICATVVVGPMY
jgi:hypothetical protein